MNTFETSLMWGEGKYRLVDYQVKQHFFVKIVDREVLT